MSVVLLVLGAALLVFGAIVLMRYADRPGGTVKLLGVEATSKSAGLPLIVIGVACVVLGVKGSPVTAASPVSTVGARDSSAVTGGTTDSSGRAVPVNRATTADARCIESTLRGMPTPRIARIEVGMRDVPVLGRHQPLDAPFGIVLTENGETIGVLRIRLHRAASTGADLYRIERAVDGACAPLVGVRNLAGGDDPTALTNWDTVRLPIAGHEYDMRIGGEGDVEVGFLSRVR